MLTFLYGIWGLFFLFSQGDSKRQLLEAKHDFFTTDNLGNVYLAQDAELVKYSAGLKVLGRYSNLRLGEITRFDATNPLKLLVYYQDYQQVVFLDNQLSPNGKSISLQEIGLEQASLVCVSVNNSFWIFDRRNNELMRFDENQKKIASTGNLRQVLNAEIRPTMMREYNNYLYLNCPEAGIYVFDIFGAFSKVLPLKNIESFQASGDLIYYHAGEKLCSFNQKYSEQKCDTIHGPGIVSALTNGVKKYLSYGDSLVIYGP